jgi:hypothetical protein
MVDCFINRVQVGEEWLNPRSDQMLLCSHSHPPGNENGDTGKRRCHGSVLLTLMAATLMTTVCVGPLPPGMMAGFADPVSLDDFPVLQAHNLIVERPPEMGADRYAIIGDECECAVFVVHDFCPF